MRTYNHLYENLDCFEKFLNEITLAKSEEILVRIHSGIHTKEEINELVGKIKLVLPKAHIIGCSAMQIIMEGKLIPHSCLVSVTVFENAKIRTERVGCRDVSGAWKTGHELATELNEKIGITNPLAMEEGKKGFLLVFFPLTYSKIEEFVDTINEAKVPVRMLGGAAYLEDENHIAREDLAYVIEGNQSSTTDVVAAYITSENLLVYGDYVCGVEAVGKKSSIKSHGCFIEEVDQMSGADWYAGMMGEEELKKNPSLAHVFPVVKRDERGIAYYVDYIVPGNDAEDRRCQLKSYGELRSGSEISMGYFHPQKIFDQMREVIQNVSENPSETIFAYDCQSRVALLHNCAGWEIGHFNATNISGALLSGEISSRNGENLYANYTFVIASLSEREDAHFVIGTSDMGSVQALQEDNAQMLNYLLLNANKHLSEELQEQQEKMRDAVFYNDAVGVDNQLKYLFDKDRENLDKTAIFSLNNEKMLRLFTGVTRSYAFLKKCYGKVQDEFRRPGLRMYCYKDTSLLIAANETILEEEFTKVVDEIHQKLNQYVYEDIKLSYTAVVVFGEEDVMNRLEAALHYAHKYKLSKIRFDEMGDDIKKGQEDVQMLWVIREALIRRLVVPFFQEIHDNTGGEKHMYESLMRVFDAEGNIYYPDRFIPVAKEYDLYDSLSELMVKTVMEMFCGKNVRVSINLNVQDIYNRDMIKIIFANLKDTPYPENFVFEIVESEEITDYEYIKGFCDRVHEYGGKIAIDDFGSGFSNILHIIHLNPDYIKVDGAIIRNITTDPYVRDFVEFINNWCVNAGRELVCEYIENEEIQKIMEELGVKYSQGYYFSKPHRWSEADE
ncbi:MAG: EAL domain-containing protein [Lachnospiraceae bacterium]